MGYYSTFEVLETDIIDAYTVLNDLTESDWDSSPGFSYWDSNNSVHSYDSAKWYDWLTDLGQLARLYPDSYLVMERRGEESPDISRVIVKHGKAVEIEPELVWPEVL